MLICPFLNKIKERNIVYLRFTFRMDHYLVNLTNICLFHQTRERLAVYRYEKTVVAKSPYISRCKGTVES